MAMGLYNKMIDRIDGIFDLHSILDNFKIAMQFCGDMSWNHIIYDLGRGGFVSNIAR